MLHMLDKIGETMYISRKTASVGTQTYVSAKKLLLAERKIDRPLIETPIRDPQRIAGKLVTPSAADQETLIRVGILASTLISADSTTSPPIPTYMDKYTTSQIRMNEATCQAYSGRFIRYQATLKPARHAVAWINVSSPLMELISKEVHTKLLWIRTPSIHKWDTCSRILRDRINSIHQGSNSSCEGCTQTKMLMKGDSAIAKAMKTLYGPDDLLGQAASKDPLSIVSCDEAGPFYIHDNQGGYRTTHILAMCRNINIRSTFNSTTKTRHHPLPESTGNSPKQKRKIHNINSGRPHISSTTGSTRSSKKSTNHVRRNSGQRPRTTHSKVWNPSNCSKPKKT